MRYVDNEHMQTIIRMKYYSKSFRFYRKDELGATLAVSQTLNLKDTEKAKLKSELEG